MNRLLFRIQYFSLLMKRQRWKSLFRSLRHRIFSDTVFYGMRTELTNELPEASSRIPIALRPLEKNDVPILFDPNTLHTEGSSVEDRIHRLLLVDAGFQKSYVAVASEGFPCAALWLLGSHDFLQIPGQVDESYPELSDGEAVLESLFTLEEYRNMGVMSTAIVKVLRLAKNQRIQRVVSFVRKENLPCIRSLERAGFERYMLIREKWFLFRRRQEIELLPTRVRKSECPSSEERVLAIELAE